MSGALGVSTNMWNALHIVFFFNFHKEFQIFKKYALGKPVIRAKLSNQKQIKQSFWNILSLKGSIKENFNQFFEYDNLIF